jgi:hypothetical protein
MNECYHRCPICQSHPASTPYVASCGHIFCYYCLRSARMAHQLPRLYQCPRCHATITSQSPLTIESPAFIASLPSPATAPATSLTPSPSR